MPAINFDKTPWSEVKERICAKTNNSTYTDNITDPGNSISIIIINGSAMVDSSTQSLFFSKIDCSDKVGGSAKIWIKFTQPQSLACCDFSFNGDNQQPSIVNFYKSDLPNLDQLAWSQTFGSESGNRTLSVPYWDMPQISMIKLITITTYSKKNHLYGIYWGSDALAKIVLKVWSPGLWAVAACLTCWALEVYKPFPR